MVSYSAVEYLNELTPKVLILVVVEDGLVQKMYKADLGEALGLNPCCSGRWSRTAFVKVNEGPTFMS